MATRIIVPLVPYGCIFLRKKKREKKRFENGELIQWDIYFEALTHDS